MRKSIAIVTIKSWNIDNAKRFARLYSSRYKVLLITDKGKLSEKRLNDLKPEYIFFPHWSWTIPESIYSRYRCVIFHMTDLPYGRGGTPLQNLIVRGHKKTMISAIRAEGGMDSGPIYCKVPLLLAGSAGDIYKRASDIIFRKMMPDILMHNMMPVPQRGKPVIFKRRKPFESCIYKDADIDSVYDHIRMLDADGYPHAFIETGNLKFEFTQAKKNKNGVSAVVKISRKDLT